MGRIGGGSIVGIIAAMVLAGIAGAVVALPALRLQGLYLALATMAFAVFMEKEVFSQPQIFGTFGALNIPRLNVLGMSFKGERAYFILLAIAFSLVGVFVLWIRRGPFGRLLAAMRDSQVACATLGLSLSRTKLAVFSMSAAIAGLGGALYGGLRTQAGQTDFIMLQSLPILLLAVVGGINTVSGALIGGMSLAMMPLIQKLAPSVEGLQFMMAGLAAVALGRNPNGIAAWIIDLHPSEWRNRRAQPPALPAPEEVRVVAPAR
jgi:branched-chain amino acid transport system permease protein